MDEPKTTTFGQEHLALVTRLATKLLDDEEGLGHLPADSLKVEAAEVLEQKLNLGLPPVGLGSGDSLERLLEAVLETTPKTSSPRFFSHLFAGRQPEAAAVEMLTGLLNNSMYTYKAAGAQILIEQVLTGRMRELAGYPSGDGTTVPGGSIANLIALLLARNEKAPEAREKGLNGALMTVYVSEEGHYSTRKGAGILGIGRQNVRKVAVDEVGRMIPAALAAAIGEDRAVGFEPICVVATAGTTVRGCFDPIDDIARVAEAEDLWLHVDGAFGASLLLHEESRDLLAGIELSDSFCWCAHKMMGVPLHCSFLLVKDPDALSKNLDEAADYLYQQDGADLNPGTRSIQCGRRNDALKLWAAWQSLGDDGWRRRLERQLHLARYVAARVEASEELELVQKPSSINVCFWVKGLANTECERLCEELNRLGLAHVSFGTVKGQTIVRLVTANPAHTEEDLDRFLVDVVRVARELEE